MTKETLKKGNQLSSEIFNIKSSLESVKKLILLSELDMCSGESSEFNAELNAKVREFMTVELTQHLKRKEQEFADL